MDRFKDLLKRVASRQTVSPKPSTQEVIESYGVYHLDSTLPAPIKKGKDFDEMLAIAEMTKLVDEVVDIGNNFPNIQTGRATVLRMERLGQKLWDIEEVSPFWSGTLLQAHEAGGVEAQTVVIAHGRHVGASLLATESIEEMEAITEKLASDEEFSIYQRYFQLRGFMWNIGSIRVGGLALRDFLNFKSGKQPPAPYYRFLVEGTVISEYGRHREVYAENMEPPNDEFPHATMQSIDVLGNSVLSVETLSLSGLGGIYTISLKGTGAPAIISEIGAKSKQICDRVGEVQKASHRAVLNPDSRDFPEIAQAVDFFLKKNDPLIDSRALAALGLSTTDKVIDFYRRTKTLALNELKMDFYELVNHRVDRMIEDLGGFAGIVTGEDASDLLSEVVNEGKEPKTSELKKTVSGIFSKTRNPDLEINPSDINWSSLPTPVEAAISFEKGLPMRFSVFLNFSNELGEDILVRTRFDLAKDEFDWNLKYDPANLQSAPADIRTFRSLLMAATGNILEKILANTVISKVDTKEVRGPSKSIPKTPRERYQDPVYALRKEARAGTPEPDQEIVSFDHAVKESSYRSFVELPIGDELTKKLASLSTVDAEIVRKAIEEYNEKGTGAKFTRKKSRGRNGKPWFTLSIGCTTPKGVRVLLKETDSEEGLRIFEIEDIRYRKDIYRANKL